jgi:hypothetical protein
MQRAIGEQTKAKPLVLAFTKADLIRRSSQWALAVEPFAQVRRAMEVSANIKPTTVTIACGPQPKAVQVPVLWCLSHVLASEVSELRDDLAYYQKLAKEAGSKAWWGNSIYAVYKEKESERSKQLRYSKQAEGRLAELAPLEWPANQLAQALTKAQRKYGLPRAFRKAARP